jgi:hypothetical protein
MRRVVWFAAIFVIALNSGVWAAGKVTVDPNEGTARAQIEEWDADARLSQKVTYEARHKAVKTILADLSEMTGITFNAGYNKNDWQVRDRKMNIFAKDITLADLMSSIARVMKFKWSVNKDQVPWTYRIYMDRSTLVEANAELSKAQRDFYRDIAQRRADYARMIDNWSDDLSQSELDNLKETNPVEYILHVQGIGAALQGMFNDVRGLRDSFINANRDIGAWPVSKLSPETQELVLNAVKKKCNLEGKPLSEEQEKAFTTTGSMLFDLVPDELGWKSIEYKKFAGTGIYINNEFMAIESLLGDGSYPTNQANARQVINILENGESSKEQATAEYLQAATEESKLLEKRFPTEPQPEVADEPDLHDKIEVKPEEKKWIGLVDFEAAVAQASGFAVVSDSYKILPGFASVSKSETELKDVLSTICEGYRYNWNKHGQIIELWSKEWFKKRTAQIPDEWVERWKANLKKLGHMSLDDYSQIAMLTTEQLVENIRTDEQLFDLHMFSCTQSTQVFLLRLYASLDADQKKSLFSEVGLDVLSFDPDQWTLMCKLFQEPWFWKGNCPAVMKCKLIEDDKGISYYNFQLINMRNHNQLIGWWMRMLDYKESASEINKQTGEKKESDKSSSAEKK